MHDSVMEFGRRHLTVDLIEGKRVVELGALNVNGSLRSHVEPLGPSEYVGVDQGDGPGVDVVSPIEEGAFGKADIVICTEVLEHAEDWAAVVSVAKGTTKAGGVLLVTTRSPGFPYHAYPDDFHRFTLEDFRLVFADMEEVALEPDTQDGHHGVLALYRKPRGFTETDYAGITVASAPRA